VCVLRGFSLLRPKDSAGCDTLMDTASIRVEYVVAVHFALGVFALDWRLFSMWWRKAYWFL
jgi:hypothetical protein